jgi:uncharacterized protein YbjT (DUF2867 family)
MKLVVIGGSGLIGSRLVDWLRHHGHQVIAASPDVGIDTLTGQGLAAAVDGASVVVDVSNSPSYEDRRVLDFFETSTRNLVAAELVAGVRHHVVLSIVGSDRLPDSGVYRAKVAQERLVERSPLPYSIVRATQFFEFLPGIAQAATKDDDTVHLAPVLVQPVAADDVAGTLGVVALGAPLNGILELAGPQRFRLDELVRQTLAAHHDPRPVVTDPSARYFGALLRERSLVPGDDAQLAITRVHQWLGLAPVGR